MLDQFIARFQRVNDLVVLAGFALMAAIGAVLWIFFSVEPIARFVGEVGLALSVLALVVLPVCGIAEMGAKKRPIRSYFLGLVSALLIFLVWLKICLALLPEHRLADTFTKSVLGDNITVFEKTIGGPPERIVRLPGHFQINYYPHGGRSRWRELIVTEIACQDEVPDMYARLQVLVGPDQCVKAMGWNGETTRMRTILGEFPGANLNQLPVEVFNELVSSDDS